jgi:hypothetical protein
MIPRAIATAIGMWMLAAHPATALAAEWFVAPGGTGTGTSRAPFGAIGQALRAARPGDTVTLRPGVFLETIRTVRAGSAAAPIRIRAADGSAPAVVTNRGAVLRIDHSFITIEGLIFDGAYGVRNAVNIAAGIRSVVMRNVEVRRSGRDCVNIGAAVDVRIEGSLIHRCLNAAGGRTDAHGIAAGGVRGLTIRDTEIHTFSGDAIQMNRTGVSGGRGWDDVRIERCRLWLAPLARAENGFPAGSLTGENALDTKVAPGSSRARITIRDTEAWGFGGTIRHQAAFNLKENIDATVDGVTVWRSDIAFRLRGSADRNGAWVRIQNAVLHDVKIGVRYENDIQQLRVWNTTFGLGVERPFEEALSTRGRPEVRNVAVLGPTLPPEAADPSNMAVGPESFVSAGSHDYRLASHSPAIDAGTAIDAVVTDRSGNHRPRGLGYDVGAHEWCAASCAQSAR